MGWQSPASQWGVSDEEAAGLPLGLRLSNNLFNIKYVPGAESNQKRWPGLLGPSEARDGGDPQMKFATVEDSGVAGAQLALRKYQSGMRTPRQIIAGQMGWTPGYEGAATNIARIAGLGLDDDLRLDTPEGLRRFLPALAEQEHGGAVARRLFRPDLFDRVVARVGGGAAPQVAGGEASMARAPRPFTVGADNGDMIDPFELARRSASEVVADSPLAMAMASADASTQTPLPSWALPAPSAGASPMPAARAQTGSIGQRVAEPAASAGMMPGGLQGIMMNPMVQAGLGLFLAGRSGGDLNAGLGAGFDRSNALVANHMKLQELQRQNAARQRVEKVLGEAGSDPSMRNVPPGLLQLAQATGDPSMLAGYIAKHPEMELERQRLEQQNQLAKLQVAQAQRDLDAPKLDVKVLPEGGSAIVTDQRAGTSRVVASGEKKMSDDERKAIIEADQTIQAATTASGTLKELMDLNSKSYDGLTAGARATVMGTVGSRDAQNTLYMNNLLMGQALDQLKATFGAAPTEGERKILLELQGSVNLPANVRKQIFERAQKLVDERLAAQRQRASELRDKTYFKPGGGQAFQQSGVPGQQSATPQVRRWNPQAGDFE